jgi:ribokinase
VEAPVVVSVGSICVDLVLVLDGPPEGTTEARRDVRVAGGKAANVAVLAARLGLGSRLVGQVGDDADAGLALAGPRRAGVDLRDVAVVADPTGFSVVLVEPGGGKTIVRRPGANLAAANAVGLQGLGDVVVVDLEVTRTYVDAAVDFARRRGAALIVDPAPAADLDAGLLAAADVITPDHAEAARITGIATDDRAGALAAAAELHARGAAVAMVKLAEGGCAVSSATVHAILEPPAMAIVDTNGSGDAFAGAVAWSHAVGGDVLAAAAAGVAASTIAATGLGGQDPLPDVMTLQGVIKRVSVEHVARRD